MIPTAPHERERERGVPSNAPNKKICHNAPNLDYSERKSEVLNRGEHEGQGTDIKRPLATAPGCAHDGGRVSKRACDTVWPMGEGPFPVNVLSVNVHQFRRETARMGLPPFSLMPKMSPQTSQWSTQVDSVLSKPLWGLSPPFILITKFAYDPCSQSSLGSPIYRKLSP